jgi:hypothetical protein
MMFEKSMSPSSSSPSSLLPPPSSLLLPPPPSSLLPPPSSSLLSHSNFLRAYKVMKRLGPIAFGSKIDVPESRRVKQIREILESYHIDFFGGLIDRAKVFRKIYEK